jgi:hypothetical protein
MHLKFYTDRLLFPKLLNPFGSKAIPITVYSVVGILCLCIIRYNIWLNFSIEDLVPFHYARRYSAPISNDITSLLTPLTIGYIIGAIHEELAFRLFLSKRQWKVIIGSIYLLASTIYLIWKTFNPTNPVYYGIVALGTIAVLVGCVIQFRKNKITNELAINNPNSPTNPSSVSKYLIFSSILYFGLIHIGSYWNMPRLSTDETGLGITLINIFVPVVMVLSQIFGGILYASIRIRMGLMWAILIHFFWNIHAAFLFNYSYETAIQVASFEIWLSDILLFLSVLFVVCEIFRAIEIKPKQIFNQS